MTLLQGCQVEHTRVRELLSEYLEGELDEEKASQVADHLSSCEECRAEHDALKKTINVISSLTSVKAPDDFAQKVQKRLRRRVRHRWDRQSPLEQKIPYETICLIMLAILAALYIILYLLPHMETDMTYQGPDPKVEKEKRDMKKSAPIPRPLSGSMGPAD